MSRRVMYLQGPSQLLNPTLDSGLIEAAYKDDPEAARAEWGGLFRQDVSAYLPDDVIDRSLCPGEHSRPRLIEVEHASFVDTAGGSGTDSMCAAVAHQERGGVVVLDQLVAIDPPFDVEKAVTQVALLLKAFGVTAAKSDRYGGDWPTQWFARHGISLVDCKLPKARIYAEVAPLFQSGRVRLIDDARLEVELRGLERTPRAGGMPDAIDHTTGSHDDRINAVAGAIWMASNLAWAGVNLNEPARGVHVSSLNYDPYGDWREQVDGYAGRAH